MRPAKKSIVAFWAHWRRFSESGDFLKNSDRQRAHERGVELLHHYDDRLGIDLALTEDGGLEMILTAYGVAEARQAVKDLVVVRPALNKIRVVAFRPAIDELFEITMEGRVFRMDQIFFELVRDADDPELLGVELHFRDHDDDDEDLLLMVAALAAQAIMGELSYMEEIGIFQLGQRSAQWDELDPLVSLPQALKRLSQEGLWETREIAYEGLPLLLRWPSNLDFDSLQEEFPKYVAVTLTLRECSDNGLPTSEYNTTLMELDMALLTFFQDRGRGRAVLVETFNGKRTHHFYVASRVDTGAMLCRIRGEYPGHELELKEDPDPGWAFIRKYTARYLRV
jgi:hypothetical protein